jgi:phage-related protein
MANNLTVASVIDKNRITSEVAWVILLDIYMTDPNTREVVETLRVARNNENIVFGQDESGNPIVYQAANFDFSVNQSQNAAPNVSIVAQDQMGFIHSRMEALAGGVLSEVQVIVVNSNRLDKPAEMEERFQIVQSSMKNGVVTFELGAENPLGIQFPRHRQWQDRCAWRFRGYGCGYNGPVTTCDYSKNGPNGCAAKNNTINFRALPGLVRMNI